MADHTVRAYTEELESLSGEISRMGGMAESLVSDAIDAVGRRDPALAESVVERDVAVDQLQREIEKRIIRILALRQPMGKDLREAIAALKIAADLERVADLGKNIAKRTRQLIDHDAAWPLRGAERMGRLVLAQLHQVLDAYASRETAEAVRVWYMDEEVDEHYNSLFREMLTYMMEDPRTIGLSAHLLFIAKNLERIGDHSTNIAETIYFLESGEPLTSERPKSDDLTAG
jgi:phosphate transport system protein